jgi:Glycosyl transferase family 2
MRCPTLAELPPQPPEMTGWPWTVETPPVPPVRPDESAWPRISIVTPSYNQGQFIEETIRSVLLQGYPDLEYIIMDGGSIDQSVEIIKKYEPWLTYWVSEKDRGAPDAINRGLNKSTGSICAWLNSDDTYPWGTLNCVATEFSGNPKVDIISGICRIHAPQSPDLFIGPSPLRSLEDFCRVASNWTMQKLIVQPEAFFRRELYRRAGPLNVDLWYCYDAMFWVRAADQGATFTSVARHWANLRRHPDQKTAELNLAYRELAHSVFDYCRAKPDMKRDQFALICGEVIALLDRIAGEERGQARRYRESTSYRIGRVVTRARFW